MGALESMLGDKKKDADLTNTLDSFLTIAKNKRDNFLASVIKSGVDAKEIPVDVILRCESKVHCVNTVEPASVAAEVGKIVKDCSSGQWQDALTDSLSTVVQVFLGSSEASEEERSQYTVFIGSLGGIFRFDYYLYSYSFTSKRLMDFTHKILVSVYVISSVDVSVITRNTIACIIARCYPGKAISSDMETFTANLAQLVEQNRQYDAFLAGNGSSPEVLAGPPAIRLKPDHVASLQRKDTQRVKSTFDKKSSQFRQTLQTFLETYQQLFLSSSTNEKHEWNTPDPYELEVINQENTSRESEEENEPQLRVLDSQFVKNVIRQIEDGTRREPSSESYHHRSQQKPSSSNPEI